MTSFTGPTEIYANADPTSSWTYSSTIDMKLRAFLDVIVIASGTSPTSYQFKFQSSTDGVNWDDVPSDEVAAGLGPSRARIWDLEDEDGTVLSGRQVKRYERCGSRYCRAAVKSTGGAGTDRIRMLAMMAVD